MFKLQTEHKNALRTVQAFLGPGPHQERLFRVYIPLLTGQYLKTLTTKDKPMKINMVYYNPFTGLFNQYRGNNTWGAPSRYFEDAQTVNHNAESPPPWYVKKEFIGMPKPMESNFVTYNGIGHCSSKHPIMPSYSECTWVKAQ